ncbi:MAG: DUF4407 domain-containing protein [Chitinophagales bacterium]|nr:DUF4407 domain-containing protein [Saprospiraceae bacterium]MCB9019440.1 DUF4407 domain-containing protein [Chitinophagales bacterium]MCB9312586.1 DUF4407 domain-containing protein [Lewinellaceae bacterium]
MKRDYYTTPRASRLMRMFWKAAGADRYLLEKSTYSDQVKYMCLGGIIVATGVMAGIAGGYAFYTIFGPRGSALDEEFSAGVSLMSLGFGVVWGLMIYNLDRFIVSSTGKGDGTEAITWQEFKGALPRIVMGAIIALTISKPVEIRMFKTEIDVELRQEQMKKSQEYLADIDSIYYGRIESERAKIEKWEAEIQEKEDRYVQLENTFTDEMGGERGASGYGPEAKKIEQQMERLEREIGLLRMKNDTLISRAYQAKEAFELEKRNSINEGVEIANGLDGLLERIKLAHRIAGWQISLFITLLFMAIELTPIFFKLMLVKSPYDFLKENVEELIKAEAGIYTQPNYYKDKEGVERDLTIHTGARRLVNEAMELQKAQKRLTQYAVEKYEEEMKRKIDADPTAFIQGDSESVKQDA